MVTLPIAENGRLLVAVFGRPERKCADILSYYAVREQFSRTECRASVNPPGTVLGLSLATARPRMLHIRSEMLEGSGREPA